MVACYLGLTWWISEWNITEGIYVKAKAKVFKLMDPNDAYEEHFINLNRYTICLLWLPSALTRRNPQIASMNKDT